MATHTVLICDDEAPIRRIVAAKLMSAGLAVIEAADGRQGLAAARQHKPSVIVSDYQMPELDGLAMCKTLRAAADTAQIPTILLTARGHMVPASDLDQTSIVRLMAKPFSARDLLNAVLELTGGSNSAVREAA